MREIDLLETNLTKKTIDESIFDKPFSEYEDVVNCYGYSYITGKPVSTNSLTEATKLIEDKDHFVWLGLFEPCDETILAVKKSFSLHELAIEDATVEHQRAKIETYGNECIFIVSRTAMLENRAINYGTTSIFLGKQFVISIRRGASHSYNAVRNNCHNHPDKVIMGPSFIAHAILDYIVDNYLPITEQLGNYLNEQEHHIFSEQFDKSTLKSLYAFKSQLIQLRSMISPMKDICGYFINHKNNELISVFPSQVKPYFRDVQDHVLRSLDAVNGLNEMFSVAMDTYLAFISINQNNVVRKLAAWAGILAVPTMIASFYGMNFRNMPELDYKNGYFACMAIMFGIAALLWYRFKKAKWI